MPTVFRSGGCRFFFFSNEGDEPPHLHVERAEAVAKFWLVPEVRLEYSRRFRHRDLTRIQEFIEANQIRILEEWDEFFEEQI